MRCQHCKAPIDPAIDNPDSAFGTLCEDRDMSDD